jgi:hypothetical protein
MTRYRGQLAHQRRQHKDPHFRVPDQHADIGTTVRTTDGQDAVWEVAGRGGEWVRERLTPALRDVHLPYYDDPPPRQRST